ncbi:MAG: anion permease [Candidatus Omnitrophica bacterium]|nr:anion permease [Candidatus Omnitrophota bacterium]
MRVSLVFVGSGILFLTRSVDLKTFIQYASFDVILFLIGMMIVIGAMKETGIFHLLANAILRMKRINGVTLFILLGIISAAFSALMGEVASILLMVAIIFDISKSLKVKAAPLIIFSVLTTNIGSASTLLGNPVGVLLALRGGLSFEDFLRCAFPVSAVVLFVAIAILVLWYRPYVKEVSARLASGLGQKVTSSFSLDAHTKISIVIFLFMIASIALHKRIEIFFGMENNAILVISPVIFAGLLIACRREKAKYYIEQAVDWTSILFFMFLFAQAGVIQASGIGLLFAEKITSAFGSNPKLLAGMALFSSGFLSSVLDNTVVVASYIPVVQNLHILNFSLKPLWWCILFGACYGGNITIIGSTANIVALGALEREEHLKIGFLEWFKIGLLVGVVSMIIAYFAVTSFNIFSM